MKKDHHYWQKQNRRIEKKLADSIRSKERLNLPLSEQEQVYKTGRFS